MPATPLHDGFFEAWCATAPEAEPGVEVAVEEAVEDDAEERLDEPWKVILYNDDIHTFEEVIIQLIKAIRCSTQEAERIAWEAHMNGKTVAYQGTFDDCFRVNGVLREIQLVTEIEG